MCNNNYIARKHVQEHLGVFYVSSYSELSIYLKYAFESGRKEICECPLCQNFFGASLDSEYAYAYPRMCEKALKYYLMAANRGLAKAQCNAGIIYEEHLCDYEKALYWYNLAAEQDYYAAISRYRTLKKKMKKE